MLTGHIDYERDLGENQKPPGSARQLRKNEKVPGFDKKAADGRDQKGGIWAVKNNLKNSLGEKREGGGGKKEAFKGTWESAVEEKVRMLCRYESTRGALGRQLFRGISSTGQNKEKNYLSCRGERK